MGARWIVFLAPLLLLCCCMRHQGDLEGLFTPLPNPGLDFDELPAMLGGGKIYVLHFSTHAGPQDNLKDIQVELLKEASDSILIATLAPNTTSFQWKTPTEDIPSCRLRLTVRDSAGRSAFRESRTVEIRSRPPKFVQTFSGEELITNQNEMKFEGGCEENYQIQPSSAGPGMEFRSLPAFSCKQGHWSYSLSLPKDGRHRMKFLHTDTVGNSSTLESTVLRDTTPPSIDESSIALNHGDSPATTNYIPISFSAKDSLTKIVALCVKFGTGETLAADDSCLTRVDAANQPNIPAAISVQVFDYFYRIGFTRGLYQVWVWVKDEAGNLSPGAMKSIQYAPGEAPSLSNVIASGAEGIKRVAQGDLVTLLWKATSSTGLSPSPLSVFYTTDDLNYVSLAEHLPMGATGGCTINPETTSDFNGCFAFSAPTSSYFHLRVSLEDKSGIVSFAFANLLNAGALTIIAGNTELGLGASSTAAVFPNWRAWPGYPDPGSFVVRKDGFLFFRDPSRGILFVDPHNGVQKIFLAKGPSSSGDGGTVSEAKVNAPLKIALDFANGLLVWDYDRIRRVDFATMTISTIIGGGDSVEDGVTADQVKFAGLGIEEPSGQAPFIPFPNGDLLFQSDQWMSPGGRFRVYHAESRIVTSIVPHGIGSALSATEDIAHCTTIVAGVEVPCSPYNLTAGFDPVTSAWKRLVVRISHRTAGNRILPSATLDLTPDHLGESLGSLETDPSTWPLMRITGRNGKSYRFGRSAARIQEFVETDSTWRNIVGNGIVGDCEDTTPAMKCALDLHDVFVDGQGQVFFASRGRIRTLASDGTIVTIAGQSYHAGDGGPAISARFGGVSNIDVDQNGQVYVLDTTEAIMSRIETNGNISKVAGDTTIAVPNTFDLAATQPIWTTTAGVYFDSFRIDRATGDVLMQRSVNRLARLKRDTGKWEDFATFQGASQASYPGMVLGVDGANALVAVTSFNYPRATLSNAFHRTYSLKNGAESSFMGVAGDTSSGGIYCAAGTPVASCSTPVVYSSKIAAASFDSVMNRWLLLQQGKKRIVVAATQGGSVVQEITLSRPALSFAYRRTDTGEEIFYCGTDGRIHKKTVGVSEESDLEWKVNSLKCSDRVLVFHPSGNSLLFPATQNGSSCVAQYELN